MKIKIKAWDTVGKCMLDWLTICQTAFNRSGELGLMYRILTYGVNKDTLIPLLFTGHPDKNGKDIASGDILKIETYLSQEYGKDILFESIKAVVWDSFLSPIKLETKQESEWVANGSNHYKYAYSEYPTNIFFLSQLESYEVEIIGNIYESPELLESKNAENQNKC